MDSRDHAIKTVHYLAKGDWNALETYHNYNHHQTAHAKATRICSRVDPSEVVLHGQVLSGPVQNDLVLSDEVQRS